MPVNISSTSAGSTAAGSQTSHTNVVTAAAGDFVVVCIASGDATVSPVTSSGPGSLTWTNDKATGFYLFGNVYSSSRVVTGGTYTITVNTSAASNAASVAFVVSGSSTLTRDQTATAHSASSGTVPSVTTGITTQADEIVIGTVGTYVGNTVITMTAGSGYTGGHSHCTPTSGAGVVSVNAEYKIVSSTGAQTADGTLSVSAQWDAGAVTYKITAVASPAAPVYPVSQYAGFH